MSLFFLVTHRESSRRTSWKRARILLMADKRCVEEEVSQFKIMKKGILYDLDGTLVKSAALHEMGWQFAAEKMGISLSPQMLEKQKGMPENEASAMMLPDSNDRERKRFVEMKRAWALSNAGKVVAYPFAKEIIEKLLELGYLVGICTSAGEMFVRKVLEEVPWLSQIERFIVFREMYEQGKPAPDGLMVALKRMGLKKEEVMGYVGDAENDYLASKAVGLPFFLFQPDGAPMFPLPPDVPRLRSHRDILEYREG